MMRLEKQKAGLKARHYKSGRGAEEVEVGETYQMIALKYITVKV
jgi:hypothetical protein